MIKPNELRVGNWVYADDKKTPIYIDSVCEWGKRPLYGIPLTAELLLRCGFENCSCGGWKERLHIENDLSFKYSFGNKSKLKYLHQLQNVYHALIGKEVTVPYHNEPEGE